MQNKPLLFDGAMGTMIIKKLPSLNTFPEMLNLTQPKLIKSIHEEYVSAGADIIETNTFSANRIKLAEYGIKDKKLIEEINIAGVEIAKAAAKHKVKIAGSVSSTGKLLYPMGTLSFSEATDAFSEQTEILVKAGVDIIIIETMTDIGELKAALAGALAVKPKNIIACITIDKTGKTISGTDIETFSAIIEGYEIMAAGINCSITPSEMLPYIEILSKASHKKVVMPNAGIPPDIMLEKKFVFYMDKILDMGIEIIGGCCGTDPSYIKRLRNLINNKNFKPNNNKKRFKVAGRVNVVEIKENYLTVIGERINPTKRKKLIADIKEEKFNLLKREAIKQKENGADILDINIGVAEIDQKKAMEKAVTAIQNCCSLPLCIDSPDIASLCAGLQAFHGKALLNSIPYKKHSMEQMFKLCKLYGAAFIGLCMDENKVPYTAREKFELAKKIVEEALNYSFDLNDILIDPVTISIATDKNAVHETVKAIKLIKDNLNVKTVLGISNVSYGMPDRSKINAAFLTYACAHGLDCAIINPVSPLMMQTVYSIRMFKLDTSAVKHYINLSAKLKKSDSRATVSLSQTPEDLLFEAVVWGDKDKAVKVINQMLEINIEPFDIINKILIPAIKKVGDRYNKGEFYLPELILGAQSVEAGFNILKPLLKKKKLNKIGTVILATVKGDVHDIGKNIVGLLLSNNGFDVIDLGKDVSAELIISEVKKVLSQNDNSPVIVGLSALMTTTMWEMKTVIDYLKTENLPVKILIGGAVVNEEFARKIRANAYAQDAVKAVEIARNLIGSDSDM